MNQKQVEHLSRKRLLEMLAEQTGKANRLERENSRLKERISDRETHLAQMSSLVELILRQGNVLDRANTALAFSILDKTGINGEDGEAGEDGEDGEDGEGGEDKPPSTEGKDYPTRDQLLMEIQRESGKRRYIWSLKTTVYALIVVAAAAVLVAVLLLPVFQIYGSSMLPTLYEGDFVVSVKKGKPENGNLVAFYYNNKILVKRVIAQSGQWVDIDEDGNVWVDNEALSEPYLTDKAKGECDIELPFQVPEGRVFVMGDSRSISVDSRSTTVGCVAEEQLIGKIIFRIWPLSQFGKIA